MANEGEGAKPTQVICPFRLVSTSTASIEFSFRLSLNSIISCIVGRIRIDRFGSLTSFECCSLLALIISAKAIVRRFQFRRMCAG